MNLILLLSLLQAWVIYTDRIISVADRLVVIQVKLSALSDLALPASLQELRAALDAPARLSIDGARSFYGRVPLSAIAKVNMEDVTSIRLLTGREMPRMSAAEIIIRSEEISEMEDGLVRMRQDAVASITAEVAALQELIGASHLPETATAGDLERSATREIRIPFLNEPVEARTAFGLLTLGSLAAILLLVSIGSSLSILLRTDKDVSFLDWLPLYPSRLAAVLGMLWVSAPLSVLLLAAANDLAIGVPGKLAAPWLSAGVVMAAFIGLTALVVFWTMTIRRQLVPRRKSACTVVSIGERTNV